MDLKPINRFMSRVKQLSDTKHPDMRIPLSEAIELAASIAELLTEQISNKTTVTNIKIKADGGKL